MLTAGTAAEWALRTWDFDRPHRQHGTPVERASIGMAISEPAPDFAHIAKGFGWWSEGPVTDPAQVRAAVQRAADHVLATGLPALVDVVCQPK